MFFRDYKVGSGSLQASLFFLHFNLELITFWMFLPSLVSQVVYRFLLEKFV